MLYKQLSYFCSVVENNSFTKAAQACFISQSAISQQVKALEADIGFPLLVREGRSFRVTPAGRLLARKGRALLSQTEELLGEVRDVALGNPTRISIGYLSRYEGWEIHGALASLSRRHPRAEIITHPGSHDFLYQSMLTGEIDVAFNDRRRSLSSKFNNVHLMTCYQYIEVSEASALAWQTQLTAADLAGTPCILVSSEGQNDTERDHYRNALNFDCNFMFARSLEEGRAMVAANQGIMPIESREPTRAHGTVIRRIPLHDARGPLSADYYAFWPARNTNPLIQEFADILANLLQEQAASLHGPQDNESLTR